MGIFEAQGLGSPFPENAIEVKASRKFRVIQIC